MKRTILVTILFSTLLYLANAQSPGGVSTQLKTWYKADAGVQNAGVNATNNQAVDTWINQAGGTYNLTQATATKRPVYHKSTANQLINYNPSMRFDGADDCQNRYTATFGYRIHDNLSFKIEILSSQLENYKREHKAILPAVVSF